MRIVVSVILLVDDITVIYTVISASTGNWASSVASLVVLIPLVVLAGYLVKWLGI